MLYPLLLKRILTRVRAAYEDFIIDKADIRDFHKYESWLKEYLELAEPDRKNIVIKFERAQAAAIIYGMRKKDREIFINQLGCFYIKQTTIDFYNALERLIGDKEEGEYDFEEIKQSALEETRALYIKRANDKRNAKKPKYLSIKI